MMFFLDGDGVMELNVPHKSTKRDTLIMTSYTKIRHGFSEKHQLWLGWLATV